MLSLGNWKQDPKQEPKCVIRKIIRDETSFCTNLSSIFICLFLGERGEGFGVCVQFFFPLLEGWGVSTNSFVFWFLEGEWVQVDLLLFLEGWECSASWGEYKSIFFCFFWGLKALNKLPQPFKNHKNESTLTYIPNPPKTT
jgi:hypothetical protein